jgi:hypothetical protein
MDYLRVVINEMRALKNMMTKFGFSLFNNGNNNNNFGR